MSTFRAMQEAGVSFGVGTESNPFNMLTIADIYAEELEGFIHAGFSAMQVIQSATLHSAEVLGLREKAGSIETGKWADLLIINENPLEDLRALVTPQLVIQAGNVVHQERSH